MPDGAARAPINHIHLRLHPHALRPLLSHYPSGRLHTAYAGADGSANAGADGSANAGAHAGKEWYQRGRRLDAATKGPYLILGRHRA